IFLPLKSIKRSVNPSPMSRRFSELSSAMHDKLENGISGLGNGISNSQTHTLRFSHTPSAAPQRMQTTRSVLKENRGINHTKEVDAATSCSSHSNVPNTPISTPVHAPINPSPNPPA